MGRGKNGSDSKKNTGGRGGQPYQVGGNVGRGEKNVLQCLSKRKRCWIGRGEEKVLQCLSKKKRYPKGCQQAQ